MALRLGALKPDWRLPNAKDVAADWKEMQVPGNWESRGLPDFDGVVWFTRTIDVPAAAATGTPTLSLGAMRNTGEVWVNGLAITPPAGGRGAGGGGRGGLPPAFALPAGTIKPGANQITVRIQNARNDGGFIGTPEQMFLEAGGNKIGDRRAVEVPRRAADQRRHALHEAGRARGARRVHRRRRPRRRRRRGAQAGRAAGA